MSYATYTTEAIVCGSSHHNTSDRQYLLFTKEAGMIFASARSVREERSKQRYALQDFSHIRVTLLKGKGGWRIGSAEAYGNPFLRAQNRAARTCINFLFAQLRRYVHGEVAVHRAYADMEWLMDHQEGHPQKGVLQQLFLVRLLDELGYIAATEALAPLLTPALIADAIAVYDAKMDSAIAAAIEAGAQASHL